MRKIECARVDLTRADQFLTHFKAVSKAFKTARALIEKAMFQVRSSFIKALTLISHDIDIMDSICWRSKICFRISVNFEILKPGFH